MWLGLALIILLVFLSIYGAFIGAERAKSFINRLPLVIYWSAFLLLLIVGLAVFRRLVRVPGLLLIHLGCVFILAGAMWSSEAGHKLQKKLLGIDKIPAGQMTIYEGYSDNRVILEDRDQVFLFSIKLEFQANLGKGIISEELRQEFEKNGFPLSQHVIISVEEPGSTWLIINELKEYLVRKKKLCLNIYNPMKELPFNIELKDFQIEYYKPAYLYVQTRDGQGWKIPVEIGAEFPLGPELGTVKTLRTFENFKITIEDGSRKIIDDPQPGFNPALEVQFKYPDGQATTKYVFERFPGHSHSEDRFLLSYRRVISDYVSRLKIIENEKVVAQKDIEVNHPLHFGGYHFYQHSYDAEAGQYTVLMVVSNTGLGVVYAGYWMLCIGVLWHLWIRHIVARIKSKNK